MSQLADVDIERGIRSGLIGFDPFDASLIQPASIDLRLDNTIRTLEGLEYELDGRTSVGGLGPHGMVLGCTMEYIRLPSTLAARIEGKSSVGRMGLAIHVTAGFVDPGFYGQLTLELVNHSGRPVFLKPGMRIAQMSFHTLSQLPRRVYGDPALGSHYQGQVGPTPSYLEETGG